MPDAWGDRFRQWLQRAVEAGPFEESDARVGPYDVRQEADPLNH